MIKLQKESVRKEFKRLVWESTKASGDFSLIPFGFEFSIGRVMQAWVNKFNKSDMWNEEAEAWHIYHSIFKGWKLTKEGKECTDDEQNIETITKLLELLK